MRAAARVLPFVLLALLAACRAQKDQPGLDPLVKDLIETVAVPLTLLVTVAGFVSESMKNRHERERATEEARLAREQQQRDLRWQKAKLAKEIVDADLHDEEQAMDAAKMLDVPDRMFDVRGIQKTVTTADVLTALRDESPGGDLEKGQFIRECFDVLFAAMQLLDHYIRVGLIELDDVRFPFAYYCSRMQQNREVFAGYMGRYGYEGALRLWSELLPAALPPR